MYHEDIDQVLSSVANGFQWSNADTGLKILQDHLYTQIIKTKTAAFSADQKKGPQTRSAFAVLATGNSWENLSPKLGTAA